MPEADSSRKPDARRSRRRHKSPLTTPVSAMRASGAVIFQVMPSRSSVTLPRLVQLAEQQGLRRAVLVVAEPDGHARWLVEAIRSKRAGLAHELLDLGAGELVERVCDHVGVGGIWPGLGDLPLAAFLSLEGHLGAVEIEVDGGDALPVEGKHR